MSKGEEWECECEGKYGGVRGNARGVRGNVGGVRGNMGV